MGIRVQGRLRWIGPLATDQHLWLVVGLLRAADASLPPPLARLLREKTGRAAGPPGAPVAGPVAGPAGSGGLNRRPVHPQR